MTQGIGQQPGEAPAHVPGVTGPEAGALSHQRSQGPNWRTTRPTRTVLVVMVGVCSMAALVWAAASGFVDPYAALVYCQLRPLGEWARRPVRGQRDVAHVDSAGAISYAIQLSLGDRPVDHSAVQVVAVATLGVALREPPHVAVGRPPRVEDVASR